MSWSGTLLLSGVDVRTADAEPVPDGDIPIFSAEQIEARFDWFSLLSGQLSATQLVATRPVFRPIENPETGHWNYERLRPPVVSRGSQSQSATEPTGAASPDALPFSLPVVMLRDASVEWNELRKGQVVQTGRTEMDGQLIPVATLSSTYRMEFAGIGFDPHNNGGIALTGLWNVAQNKFEATADNVDISETLKLGLPATVRQFCEEHQLKGRLQQIKLSFNEREGPAVVATLDGVSMINMVEPEQGIGMGEYRPSYLLPAEDVRGTLAFLPGGKGLQVHLTGKVLGYNFQTDAWTAETSFDGRDHGAPFTMSLSFPDAVLSEPYPPLFMAFLTGQDLIQRVEPYGKVDIGITLKRLTPHAPIKKEGIVDCHGVRMRFAHFPFPLNLQGRVTFDDDSVTFHNVEGVTETTHVNINGTTGTVWTNPAIDFTVSSTDAVFDDRLGACLPQKFASLWDSFSLDAAGGFVCRVTRSNSFFDMPKVVIDVDVKDGAGYFHMLPYAFTGAHGHIRFEGDQTTVDHMTLTTGTDHSGKVTLNGVVRHPGGDLTNLVPELNIVADLPIERPLLMALPPTMVSPLKIDQPDAINLGGRIWFDGQISRTVSRSTWLPTHEGESIQLAGEFRWTQGTISTLLQNVPVNLTGISAEIIGTPEDVTVRNFAGTLLVPVEKGPPDQVQVKADGKIEVATLGGAFNVSATAASLTLPADAPAFFPKGLADAWNHYHPIGQIDLKAGATLHIRGNPGDSPATAATVPATKPAFEFGAVSVDAYDLTLTPIHGGLSLKAADWPGTHDATFRHDSCPAQ